MQGADAERDDDCSGRDCQSAHDVATVGDQQGAGCDSTHDQGPDRRQRAEEQRGRRAQRVAALVAVRDRVGGEAGDLVVGAAPAATSVAATAAQASSPVAVPVVADHGHDGGQRTRRGDGPQRGQRGRSGASTAIVPAAHADQHRISPTIAGAWAQPDRTSAAAAPR